MPFKGISVGLFFSCFEKIGKHHEPRKRTTYAADGTSGGTRGRGKPSPQRGAARIRNGNAKHSALPNVHSPLRVRARTIPSLPCAGRPNATLPRHALRHALWRLSTTWLPCTNRQPALHRASRESQRSAPTRATVSHQCNQRPRATAWNPGRAGIPCWIPATANRLPSTGVSAVHPHG